MLRRMSAASTLLNSIHIRIKGLPKGNPFFVPNRTVFSFKSIICFFSHGSYIFLTQILKIYRMTKLWSPYDHSAVIM